MSLANKYRPKTFQEVVGQQKIVEILSKEIETNNIKQAYLFVGNSGCGKSSCSRILANTLNAYTIEIDAASNNSADKMRELIESVKQPPLFNDYTVVILDEAHSLSSMAVQTLLKIIESPPKHLIFIMCTTEVDKIPQTIYNRCEVFEFTKIGASLVQERLQYICFCEKFGFSDDALEMIAQLANGSMRQAITYLEQCSTKTIDVANVKQTLLAGSYDTCCDLLFALCDKNKKQIVEIINNIPNIDKFIEQFFSFILDANIYVYTQDKTLIKIPTVYTEDFDKLDEKDILNLVNLRKLLTELQFKARNNPILRQLFIATFFTAVEGC